MVLTVAKALVLYGCQQENRVGACRNSPKRKPSRHAVALISRETGAAARTQLACHALVSMYSKSRIKKDNELNFVEQFIAFR